MNRSDDIHEHNQYKGQITRPNPRYTISNHERDLFRSQLSRRFNSNISLQARTPRKYRYVGRQGAIPHTHHNRYIHTLIRHHRRLQPRRTIPRVNHRRPNHYTHLLDANRRYQPTQPDRRNGPLLPKPLGRTPAISRIPPQSNPINSGRQRSA